MTFLEQMEFTNRENRFMNHCGVRITHLDRDCCRAELLVEEYCKNTGNMVQGGLLYTMADCAASAYARAVSPSPVTLSGDFHYFKNVSGGTVVAEAVPVRLGRTVLVFRVTVRAGEDLLAEGTLSCLNRAQQNSLAQETCRTPFPGKEWMS